MAAQKRC